MNRLFITIILVLILSLGFTTITNAESGSFWFSGGSKDGNGSFAFGFGFDNIGFEVGVIDDTNTPKGTLDYECPHWDYTSLGERTTASTVGIDLIGMINLSNNVTLYGGPGLYWHHTGEIVRSNASGWYYTQSSETTSKITCSGGIRFKFAEEARFGIGYHSLRGTNLTFEYLF